MNLQYKKYAITAGVLAIPAISLIIAICLGLHYEHEYKVAEDEYEQLEQEYAPTRNINIEERQKRQNTESQSTTVTLDVSAIQFENADFQSLQSINSDVIAWITIPGCNINYPVVQGRDNEKYLTTTYKGSANSSGAIFIDYENSPDFSDTHTLMYGHNMKNGSMFGGLKKLRNNPSEVNKSPYLYLFTPDGKTRQYRIFSVREVDAESSAYRFFSGNANYDEYIDECINESKSGITQTLNFATRPSILTLSTCSGEDGRVLVHCALISTF